MRRSESLEAVRRASLDQVDRARCLRNAYDTRCPSRRTVRPMVETKTRRGRSRPGIYQRRGVAPPGVVYDDHHINRLVMFYTAASSWGSAISALPSMTRRRALARDSTPM
jgi:hypothetical protein